MTLTVGWKRVLTWCACGLVVAGSLYARLSLAARYYGNYDQESYEMVVRAVGGGGSAYSTGRYNYSPFWSHNLVVLDYLGRWSGAAFHTVVRSYLTLVDLVTAIALFALCRRRNGRPYLAASLFLLNPIGVYVTGYHGQFDNLSILLVVLALLCFAEEEQASWKSYLPTALLLGASILVKQVTAFVPFVFVLRVRGLRRRAIFVLACYLPFFVTLLPHWIRDPETIRRNVVGYQGGILDWGLSPILASLGVGVAPETYRLALIVGLVAAGLLWSRGDVVQSCLLSMLALFVFMPSFANQYLIWPVALGAINASWLYVVFLAYGSSFLWGPTSPWGLTIGAVPDVPGWLEWTLFAGAPVVWSIAVFWFCALLRRWAQTANVSLLDRRWLAVALTGVALVASASVVKARRPRLIVTADNAAEVWLDGEEAGRIGAWEQPLVLPFPSGRDRALVAVEASNQGGAGGLIGRTRGGSLFESTAGPAAWVCSSSAESGWNRTDFDDSGWSDAAVVAEYGADPWAYRAGATLRGASWVWLQVPVPAEDRIHCRWWAMRPGGG